MGIPLRCIGTADTKKASQHWLVEKYKVVVEHVFHNNACLVNGHGRCHMHGGSGDSVCRVSEEVPDVASGGLPCQSFSQARHKTGASPATWQPWEHPTFGVVMSEFMRYIANRKPLAFWIEEVDRFDQVDSRTGESYLKSFMRSGAALGYAMRALLLDHSVWVELPRRRIYVFGVGPKMGHAQGADFICSLMHEIQSYRELTPTTAVFDLWDPDDPEESSRLRASEELWLSPCLKNEDRTQRIRSEHFGTYIPGG